MAIIRHRQQQIGTRTNLRQFAISIEFDKIGIKIQQLLTFHSFPPGGSTKKLLQNESPKVLDRPLPWLFFVIESIGTK
jgi:hypothetical protein